MQVISLYCRAQYNAKNCKQTFSCQHCVTTALQGQTDFCAHSTAHQYASVMLQQRLSVGRKPAYSAAQPLYTNHTLFPSSTAQDKSSEGVLRKQKTSVLPLATCVSMRAHMHTRVHASAHAHPTRLPAHLPITVSVSLFCQKRTSQCTRHHTTSTAAHKPKWMEECVRDSKTVSSWTAESTLSGSLCAEHSVVKHHLEATPCNSSLNL